MDAWLSLFRIAMDVLDDTPPGLIGDDWTIGGGTMLYRRFGHRLSKDIDIFLTSPQMLPALSPRLNTMAEARSRSYVEQSNYVKLVFPAGEIDFIVAPHLLTPYATREDIEGRSVWVEHPAEILAKKVLYRASDFTARDLFDFAFLIETGDARPLLDEPETFARPLAVIAARVEHDSHHLQRSFEVIEATGYHADFQQCRQIVLQFVSECLPDQAPTQP